MPPFFAKILSEKSRQPNAGNVADSAAFGVAGVFRPVAYLVKDSDVWQRLGGDRDRLGEQADVA